ncbi:MAG: hypothetical protein KC468_15280, partial [Myxococcales bacterium]|nr:hypothetical protein [Myxococcales bacterium]
DGDGDGDGDPCVDNPGSPECCADQPNHPSCDPCVLEPGSDACCADQPMHPSCNDNDGDGIPNDDDPFPDDANLPGVGDPFKVYAHTSGALFTMEAEEPYTIQQVGGFTFNQSPGQVTDIALDRFGVLYAITFNDLFVCNPQTAQCYYLADIPQTANGLTMIPPGVIDPDDDTLVAIANNGTWYRVMQVGNQANFINIGGYNAGYSSSGDCFSIENVGTYCATNKTGVNNGDVIIEANPMNGGNVQDIATTVGYNSLFGLAGWQGAIFGFNSGGQVIKIDPENGTVTLLTNSNNGWWGAGVRTIIPQ